MTVYLRDPDVTLHHGDALETLRGLPDESVHCVVTSPPYWGLRCYGVDGQLGLEPTPELYVQNMVAVFREVRRVLRRDGTCWLNMGDTYNSRLDGSHGGWNGGAPEPQTVDHRGPMNKWQGTIKGLGQKQLLGMPWRLAFALQADGWWLRADIIWAKPNPMPESVTDRPTKAHEYVFLLTRSPRYFFDQEAVRESFSPSNDRGDRIGFRGGDSYVGGRSFDNSAERVPAGGNSGDERLRPCQLCGAERGHTVKCTLNQIKPSFWGEEAPPGPDGRRKTTVRDADGSIQHRDGERWPNAGRNVRSVWEIATEPFPAAHFATFPTELARRCILAGTSERGCCPECGAPWERETTARGQGDAFKGEARNTGRPDGGERRNPRGGQREWDSYTAPVTLGWRPTCDCDKTRIGLEIAMGAPVPCTVLDPFAGACTVPLVARNHGRHAIGIELSETYLRDIALPRLQQLSLLTGAR